MRAVCGIGFVVVVATTSVAAGPLGPVWRAKLATTTCPELTETADGFVTVHDGAITRFDRVTGVTSALALPKLAPHATGSFYIEQVTGSTAVVEYFTGATFGVDTQTHAIVWTRDHDPADHATSQSVYGAGHDVVLAHLVHAPYAITMERFDAETGATKWTAAVPTKRAIIDRVVTTPEHVYVITREYGTGRSGSTITALDHTGKVAWTIDDPDEFWQPSVFGEDLVLIRDDKIRRYAAATGTLSSFDVDWNAQPLQANGSVYTTPVNDTVEAFDLTGKQRWSTALPPRGAGMPRFAAAIGVVHGLVYVEDGQVLRTFDEATGAAVASLGTGYGDPAHTVRMHACGRARDHAL